MSKFLDWAVLGGVSRERTGSPVPSGRKTLPLRLCQGQRRKHPAGAGGPVCVWGAKQREGDQGRSWVVLRIPGGYLAGVCGSRYLCGPEERRDGMTQYNLMRTEDRFPDVLSVESAVKNPLPDGQRKPLHSNRTLWMDAGGDPGGAFAPDHPGTGPDALRGACRDSGGVWRMTRLTAPWQTI